jgi:alkylhydroperoxidase/carboxymuconolactone decarboxylase family protein YurZ
MLNKAGFADAQMVAETGFNSSPKTKGALVRATKAGGIAEAKDRDEGDLLSSYQAFFDQTYAQGALDRKTKHLIALGASLAAGCEA